MIAIITTLMPIPDVESHDGFESFAIDERFRTIYATVLKSLLVGSMVGSFVSIILRFGPKVLVLVPSVQDCEKQITKSQEEAHVTWQHATKGFMMMMMMMMMSGITLMRILKLNYSRWDNKFVFEVSFSSGVA